MFYLILPFFYLFFLIYIKPNLFLRVRVRRFDLEYGLLSYKSTSPRLQIPLYS